MEIVEAGVLDLKIKFMLKVWRTEKNEETITKNVLLAFCSDSAMKFKSSNLWAQY